MGEIWTLQGIVGGRLNRYLPRRRRYLTQGREVGSAILPRSHDGRLYHVTLNYMLKRTMRLRLIENSPPNETARSDECIDKPSVCLLLSLPAFISRAHCVSKARCVVAIKFQHYLPRLLSPNAHLPSLRLGMCYAVLLLQSPSQAHTAHLISHARFCFHASDAADEWKMGQLGLSPNFMVSLGENLLSPLLLGCSRCECIRQQSHTMLKQMNLPSL
jgi:hypothetical protein